VCSDNIMVVCLGKMVDRVQGRLCRKVIRISRNEAIDVAVRVG
jgi:hypothetical protein